MAKKTNKTSHVMNLLTNGAASETENPAEASASAASSASEASDNSAASVTDQEKKGDVQSHTISPKKVTVVDEGSRNDRLSQEILNNLEKELEEEHKMENQEAENTQTEAMEQAGNPETEEKAAETASPKPQNENTAAEATISDAPEPSDSAASAEAPAAAPQPKPAPPKVQPSSKTAHHAIILKNGADDNLINNEYRFVNIMEHLILRQDISAVLTQYNVCNCTRCMADVCALALTSLPPKYVVTSKDSLSPLLSYYESRNKIPMLTALIKACNTVRENPRHKR